MEAGQVGFLVAALLVPPLLLVLFIVIAALLAKRKMERKAAAVGEQVLERTRQKLTAQGLDSQAVEARVQALTATVGDRITALADERGVDLEEAKEQFFTTTNNLAIWLDSKVKLPFGQSFGLDPVIGLIPIIGSMGTSVAASVVVLNSLQYGIPTVLVLRMAFNIALDYVVGFVPVIGTVIDIFFRASNRNMKLLEEHLKAK